MRVSGKRPELGRSQALSLSGLAPRLGSILGVERGDEDFCQGSGCLKRGGLASLE